MKLANAPAVDHRATCAQGLIHRVRHERNEDHELQIGFIVFQCVHQHDHRVSSVLIAMG